MVPPVERSAWEGLVNGREEPSNHPVIVLPLQPSNRGGSGTFLAADQGGNQWWVKPLNNIQGPRVTVTEAIVGTVGRLIGAPVCETAIVELPDEIAGWPFRPGCAIEAGFAHGSRAVDSAIEQPQLDHRDRDDNARRHAGVYALYDWCWGGDDQWLYSQSDDAKLFSHDHGWYFPDTGATWNQDTLSAQVDVPHQGAWAVHGLDAAELRRLSDALRSLSPNTLADALRSIPPAWPVTNQELEAVGWFLESRAPAVAARLTAIPGRGSS